MALEHEFDCEMLDEETEQITTVQAAIDYLAERLEGPDVNTLLI